MPPHHIDLHETFREEAQDSHVCDMCGIHLDSNVAMHNVGNRRSYCMDCHILQHAEREDPVQRKVEHRETIGRPMSDSDLEKIRLGEKTDREKVAVRNNSEAYANRRLGNIGGEVDKSENKAAGPQIEYIPVDQCVDGRVYRIRARNGRIGRFVKSKNNAFVLSRHKFGQNFLYEEYHWDNGEPYGTVMPLEDLGEASSFLNEQETLDYLNELTKTVKGKEYPKFEELKKKLKKDD